MNKRRENILVNFDFMTEDQIQEYLKHKAPRGCVSCIYFPDEVWKRVNDPVLKDVYWVSTFGRVYNEEYDFVYMGRPNKNSRYVDILMDAKDGRKVHKRVHILVLEQFYPNPDPSYYTMVNHKNGIKMDNRLDNLEWSNSSLNTIHSYNMGLEKRGEDFYNAIFTNEDVHRICKLFEEGYSVTETCMIIANVNDSSLVPPDLFARVSNIANRSCWTHISCLYNIDNRRRNIDLNDEEAHAICRILESEKNITNEEVLRRANLLGKFATGVVTAIRNGRSHIEISSQYNIEKHLVDRSHCLKWPDEKIHTACKLMVQGYKYIPVLNIMGEEVTQQTRDYLKSIKRGYTRPDIGRQYGFYRKQSAQ